MKQRDRDKLIIELYNCYNYYLKILYEGDSTFDDAIKFRKKREREIFLDYDITERQFNNAVIKAQIIWEELNPCKY